MDLTKILSLALNLDKIANTSYFPSLISQYVKQYLQNVSSIQVAEDEYAIYAHYSCGKHAYKLILDTHLDHPGFVTVGSGKAIPIGTIATPNMVPYINKNQGQIPVHFYDQDKEVGQGYLHNLEVKKGRTVMQAYLNGKKLSPNLQAIPIVEARQVENFLHMRSADNLSVTAVALEYIQWLVEAKVIADVTIIFTKLEEVRQISATAIASKKKAPFGIIDQASCIIVLEAGLVGSTPRTRQVAETKEIDYDSGALIRVSDHELAYKQPGKHNLAEALMLQSRDILHAKTQHGPSIGNCNALPYIFFSSCPHVTSLMIPTRNKHNFDEKGRLTHEIIWLEDIATVSAMLQQATHLAEEEIQTHPDQILMRDNFSGHTSQNIESHKKAWRGALAWGIPHLREEYVVPTSPSQYIQTGIASIRSRLSRSQF